MGRPGDDGRHGNWIRMQERHGEAGLYNFLAIANKLNEGNPGWKPYDIPKAGD
ncbi:MAG TPA: hypothetical protein VFE27_24245 [Acidobacteriaceae bacterium]|nr:hypothetical protein [Acidobacteriaceae bacterium]